MDSKMKYSFKTKKRIFALVTLLVMIVNWFSPYSSLIAYAADPAAGEPYVTATLPTIDPSGDPDDWDDDTYYYYIDYDSDYDTPETYDGLKLVYIPVVFHGCNKIVGMDLAIKYDSSKLIPYEQVNENIGTSRKPNWVSSYKPASDMSVATSSTVTSLDDFANSLIEIEAASALDTSAGTLRLAGTMAPLASGGSYYGEGDPIVTFLFALEDGVSISDITDEAFQLLPGDVNKTGLKITYLNSSNASSAVEGTTYFKVGGFASSGKLSVDSVTITKEPKNKYYNTETLDFTGGEITINYSDGTSKVAAINDAVADGTVKLSSTTANNTTKKVTLTVDTESVDFNYYVLESLAVGTNPTKMTYDHGDTLDFTGGTLNGTYKNASGSSVTGSLNIKNEITAGNILVNKTKADVDNKTVTFTYKDGKTANLTFTVKDPVESISISANPTKLTYMNGDAINLAGGTITPHTKSGNTLTPVAMTAASVKADTATADIGKTTTKWNIAGGGGLQAGNQPIKVTYTDADGKTFDQTFTVVVNDTVDTVTITKQPTAANKYGIAATGLSFTGLEATVTTTGGGSFVVKEGSITVDKSSYNPNSLNKQSFPAKYGTISTTNNVEISLSNYITGITTNFSQTSFPYGTELSTVASKGTYKEVYADGSSSADKAITTGMILNYVKSPAASLFGSTHIYTETVTVQLLSGSSSFDLLPATKTQNIVIEDYVSGISIKTKPTKINYNYGDTFSLNGGYVQLNYKSGASASLAMNNPNFTMSIADGTLMKPDSSKFSSGTATIPVTVSYNAVSPALTATFDVNVKDAISSIAMKSLPTKTSYNHGDSFNDAGGSIEVTYLSGNKETVALSKTTYGESDGSSPVMSPSASVYDTNNQYEKTIAVSYGGKSTSFKITLNNILDKIAVDTSPKTNYNLGDSTTGVGGTIKVTRLAGNTATVNIEDSMVTNLTTASAGTGKVATITYTDGVTTKTTTYTYNVKDNVVDITITPPTKTTYAWGEALNLTGSSITVKYASGSTNPVTMTTGMITKADLTSAPDMKPTIFDSNFLHADTLKITYTEDGITKTVDYDISIINDVKSISVHTNPTKLTYNIGESIDLTDGEILVTRSHGTPEVVSMSNSKVTVDGFTSATASSSLPVTVKYTENGITKTATFNVEIKDAVTNITPKATPTVAKYGEELDLSTAKMDVTSGSGTKEIAITSAMISGYDKNTLGSQTVTVTYGALLDGTPATATFNVTVQDYVKEITLNKTTANGKYNDSIAKLISDNALTYTVVYASKGAQAPVAVDASMVSGYNPATISAQTVTVTYTDADSTSYTKDSTFTKDFSVSLGDTLASIAVTAPTSSQVYNHGDALDLTGAKITLNYSSGAKTDVTPTAANVVEKGTTTAAKVEASASDYATNDNKVTKAVTLTYTQDGFTDSVDYNITVINDIKNISVHTAPTKLKYNIGESLDLTNVEIKVERAVGVDSIKSVDASMVTGFDSSIGHTALPVTISYTENGITKTTSFNVDVVDTVISIDAKGTPAVAKFGEELDLSTSTIDIVKGSGTSSLPITASMLSGYNKNSVGTQTVTVTYGVDLAGNPVTDTFQVEVKDYVKSIKIAPPSVTGVYGNALADIIADNAIKYTVEYASAGDKTAQAVTESMVSGYDATKTTKQTLTVSYVDADTNSYTNGDTITGTFEVTLANAVTAVSIDVPTKGIYDYGSTLELSTGIINLTYADGTTGTKALSLATVKETDGSVVNMSPASFGSTNKLTKTVVFTYTEDGVTDTKNYTFDIINNIKSISVNSTTHKTAYNVNDSLDTTDLEIKIQREVGIPSVIGVDASMISGFDSTAAQPTQTLTITYVENGITKTTTYDVSIVDTVTAIDVKGEPTVAKYGEELDLTGTSIDVTKGSGTTTIPVTASMISGYDKNTVGNQTVTVTYGIDLSGNPVTDTFQVNVKDYVKEVQITPNTLSGNYGDSLSSLFAKANVTYTVVYASKGAQTPVAFSDTEAIGSYDPTSTAKQTLSYVYHDNDTDSYTNGQDITGTFDVQISNSINSITITVPTKATYNHGDSIETSTGKITINYVDGKSTDKDLSLATVKEADGSAVNMSPTTYGSDNKVTKTITYSYTENGITATENYTFDIINNVVSVDMHTVPTKVDYSIGDTLDVTDGEIKVTRAYGTPSIKSIVPSMVTGFDSSTVYTALPLTVTYTENGITKTTSYDVTVTDTVTGVTVNAPTSTQTYNYGDTIDLTGASITVSYSSGVTQNVTPDNTMVFDKGTTTVAETKPSDAEFASNGNKVTKAVTLYYEVDGKSASVDFDIDVINDIKGVAIHTTPSKVSYGIGDTLNASDGEIIVTRAVGTPEILPMTDANVTVTGFDSTTVHSNLPITVSYSENGITKSASYNVDVTDIVTGVTVTAPTVDQTYNYNDSIDLTGATITVDYSSGVTDTITADSSMIFEKGTTTLANTTPSASEFASNGNVVTKTVTLKYSKDGYTDEVDFNITIVNNVTAVSIYAEPDTTTYNVNESLDLTNGEVLVTRAVGTPEVIPMSDSRVTVTGFTSAAANPNLPIKVEFTENGITKDTSFNIDVVDTVTSISVNDFPTEAVYGEELDLSTATVTATKGSGNTTEAVTTSMISGYNKNLLGNQTVTITYGVDKNGNPVTVTINVNVKDYVTGITVNPNSIVGTYNNTLNELISDNGIKFTVSYASGTTTTPVAVTDGMISGYNPQTTATQDVTVSYIDTDSDSATNGTTFSDTLTIELEDHVNSFTINNPPTEALYGEELDFSATSFDIVRDSGSDQVNKDEVTITGYDKNTVGTQNVTIEYGGISNVITVEVKDYLTGINLVAPTKTQYLWSTTDTLDLTGGTVEKVWASGALETPVDLTDTEVTVSTNFNPSVEGTQTISVTYAGFTETFEVEVIDNVYSIHLNSAPTSAKFGQEIDLTGTTLDVEKDSGTHTINVDQSMLSGYDSSVLGTQTVQVTYGGLTETFDITVEDYLLDYVLTAPSKDTYEYGEGLDLTDGRITRITASGNTYADVPLDMSMISGYNPTELGPQTITVTYDGMTKTFPIMVVDNIQSISIATLPNTNYRYGDNISASGGQIAVTRSSGTTIIPMTGSMIYGYNPNLVGTQTVQVGYEGFVTTFDVTVSDYVKDIDITYPSKLVYKIGESLDLTGGEVVLTMASGAVAANVPMDGSMISGFDTSSIGAKVVTVTYQGMSRTFGISVIDPLTDMHIETLPNKLVYLYGDGMDLTGGSIAIARESGDTDVLPMDGSMISGFTTGVIGQVLVTVTYEGMSDSFYIDVEDFEVGATLVAPTKTQYEYGEDLDLTGGRINIMMASGATKESAELTSSMVSGYNPVIVGNQTITVDYKGYVKTFTINLKDSIAGISLASAPTKTIYQNGENIDTTGGTIKVIRTSGVYIVNITPSMISGYNPSVGGYQTVKVNYEGFTTDLVVYVYPKVEASSPTTNNTPTTTTATTTTTTTAPSKVTTTASRRPTTTTTVNKVTVPNTTEKEEVKEEPVVETPTEVTPVETQPKVEKPVEELPTVTLGEKDTNVQEKSINKLPFAILAIAVLFLLLLLLTRKNTEIYIIEDEELVLGGKERLSRRDPKIDIDQYLDEESYKKPVTILLNDNISEKLDGKTIRIKYKNKFVKVKIKYNDEPIEIELG